jgi:hypothetical protein
MRCPRLGILPDFNANNGAVASFNPRFRNWGFVKTRVSRISVSVASTPDQGAKDWGEPPTGADRDYSDRPAEIDEEFRSLVLYAGAESSADPFRGLPNSPSIFACAVSGRPPPISSLRSPPRYNFESLVHTRAQNVLRQRSCTEKNYCSRGRIRSSETRMPPRISAPPSHSRAVRTWPRIQ